MASASGVMHAVAPNNPILKYDDYAPNNLDNLYACDPSAEVFINPATNQETLYLYCSHDDEISNSASKYSLMADYMILSTTDMVNWTNHGVVLEPRDYLRVADDGQMNAPDAVLAEDGMYYWYYPYEKEKLGVSKSSTPIGPWVDALEPIIPDAVNAPVWEYIFDPTVFVDDDGQAYVYGNDLKTDFGGDGVAHIYGAKLKPNMIELDGPWHKLATQEVKEAVTIFKRDGVYYFMARDAYQTGYWMADNPLPYAGNPDNPTNPVHNTAAGYASYQGRITPDQQGDSPVHMSAAEFKGQWYFFYHQGLSVNNGNSWRRSACFEEMFFNADGTIQFIDFTKGDQSATIPTGGVEAEAFTSANGLSINSGGEYIEFINDGDSAQYNAQNIGNGNYEVSIRYAAKNTDVILQIERANGTPLATMTLPATGDWNTWATATESFTFNVFTTNLVLKFEHPTNNASAFLCNVDWFNIGAPEYDLVQFRKSNALNYALNGGGAAPSPGQNLKLWAYSSTNDAAIWEEISRGNGYFSYQKVGTGYSIDGGSGGSNTQNVDLQVTDANDFDQHWEKVDKGNGNFQLKKRNANFGINGGNGGSNGQNANLYNANSNSQNLQWVIEYQ